MDVTITNSQFNNNISDSYVFIDDTGLLINSAGNVFLDNVEAKENRLIGADIVATGNVTITSSTLPPEETPLTTNGSSFSHNQGFTCVYTCDNEMTFHGYGLQVLTPGEILLDGVTADENHLWGASLNGSKVTVNNSTFNNNIFSQGGTFHGYGLQVVATGDILLNGVTASGNGTTGAILNTSSNVVVSNSTFDLNKGTGLSITTPGQVTLTNVIATNNGLNGVEVIGACTTTVDVVGGTYSNNGKYGLYTTGATLTLDGSQTFANNTSGNVFQTLDGCPDVAAEAPTTTATTDAVGGNVAPQGSQPAEGNPEEDNALAYIDTTGNRRHNGHDNRYHGVALQFCKRSNFRGHFFSCLPSGMEFSENYHSRYSHRYGHRH
jgi:hypothetical protein